MEKKKVEQCRVVISKEANESLERELEQIINGCDSVNMTKCDLAEYVFLNLGKLINDSDVKKIRNQYFDEQKAIKMLAKQARSKKINGEMKKVIRDYFEQALKKDPNDILKTA